MFYNGPMAKTLTPNQLLGEIGEAAARHRFLTMGFQFDGRSRLEAGIDGIAEVMDNGRPLARMIAVQVKARESGKYTSEDEHSFSYLLREEDLNYWKGSNLPIIIVLYRKSDETFFWKEVTNGIGPSERRLIFDKKEDILDRNAVDKLAHLTVPKAGFGYYIPPLGDGEAALVNILPVTLPKEIFVASSPYSSKQAIAMLFNGDEPPRFDWTMKGGSFWSFHDPRNSVCKDIVDLDQVEAIDTPYLAFHEEVEERNNFSFLLRQTLRHQVRHDLDWNKERKLFYFRAEVENESRNFSYESSKKKTDADVVNVARNKTDKTRVEFVRHHAFEPRFERLYNEWFLVVNPTYFFTTNGFIPHSYPHALLAGKKRLDNSASLRGQVIMWHRYLTQTDLKEGDMFAPLNIEPRLTFGAPPTVTLSTRVPEDVWGSQKKVAASDDQKDLLKAG